MLKTHFRPLVFLSLLAATLVCVPSSATSQEVEAWTNLGLYGGQIYDIAIDPSNPDKMFAGSYMGDGLFVTTDGGSSWQAVKTENEPEGEGTFKNHTVWAVKIAPSNNNVIWVAHNQWVEKSTDGGQTWTHIPNADMQADCVNCSENEDYRFCQAIAIHPTDPNIVYVGTGGPGGSSVNGAIYKTEDGGDTWTKLGGTIIDFDGNPIAEFNYPLISIQIDANSNNIWAATGTDDVWYGSLYRSNDQGQTWREKTHIDTKWFDMALQPHPTGQPSQVFIATAFGLLRYTFDSDDGATPLTYSWVLGGAWGTENLFRSVVFDPQNPEIVYAAWRTPTEWWGDGIGKVGRSTDGGDSWSVYELEHKPLHLFYCLAAHPTNPELVFAGHLNRGVYKSQDHGQTWAPVNDGLTAVVVKDVAVDPNSATHVLIGTNSGVYEGVHEETDSIVWSRRLENDTWSVLFHPTESLTFFAGMEGHVYKTTDGGLSWTFVNIPDNLSYNNISDIAIDTSNTDVMFVSVDYFGDGGAIHKSTDGGSSFTGVLDGVNQAGQNVPMNAVAIDPLNPQHIFAGGGLFFAPGAVGDLWESTDRGVNWTRTSLQNVIVNAILIDPQNSDIVYAGCGYSGGTETPLYKSIDGGATWSPSFDGMPGSPPWNGVTDLEFHPKKTTDPLYRDVVYASTLLAGVYVSPNEARKWVHLGTPEYDVFAISTSSLYAATQGGLLQCTGTGVIAGQVTNAVSHIGIHMADVSNDFGVRTISIGGQYMMVSPSGICDVTATADRYLDSKKADVTVYGGDVTWAHIPMPPDSCVIETTPYQDAGIDDATFIANDTSFGVHIDDPEAIDITDPASIRLTINDGTTEYTRNLSHPSVTYRKIVSTEDDTHVTKIRVRYDRSNDDEVGDYAFGSTVNVRVDVKDIAQETCNFRVASEQEHNNMEGQIPAVTSVTPELGLFDDEAGQDAGIQVTSRALKGAVVIYSSDELVEPSFGPTDVLPALSGGVGVPMNLEPTGWSFDVPVKIYIPCPGYIDVSDLCVFFHNGVSWVQACNSFGIVQPGGENWMVPHSRKNHNGGEPSTIEIQVYHFSGVQASSSTAPSADPTGRSGGTGGGGGGCFVATAAYGSALSKQVEILRKFRDIYLLQYSAGQKLVGFYYRTGKPVATYIESHPWLKGPARVILYPMVGLAWLLLSTTPFAKGVIGVCVLVCCVGAVRKVKARKNIPEVR